MINIKFRGCFFPSQLVITRWTRANKKRANCSVSSSLFLYLLCFLFGQKQCSKRWLVVCFLRNETQMKFKCGFNSNVHGVLFLSATCDWMIVLQSLKFENFTTFFILFALLSGWFGEFFLFLLNYLEFICMVAVYHVHVVVRQELFDFFSFDFILLMHCCLSLTCGCKTRTFWFFFFWCYTTDALLSITYMWL